MGDEDEFMDDQGAIRSSVVEILVLLSGDMIDEERLKAARLRIAEATRILKGTNQVEKATA